MRVHNYIESIRIDLDEELNSDYTDLYSSFDDERLIDVLSTLHHLLIENFKLMNSLLPTRDSVAHYWAEPSRVLIQTIDHIRGLERALSKTKYSFKIEQDYQNIFEICESFLSASGGSEVPNGMNKIELYYTIPIFISNETVSFQYNNSYLSTELKFIGEGSYAKVFKFKDPYYKKNFVIKRALKSLTENELTRFKLEFKLMKDLNSPYIVDVFVFNSMSNEYTMEYVDFSLNDYINENNSKLSLLDRAGIIRQIFRAFKYIHSKNILHRDISPKNILVKKYDHLIIIKIADFGLVKIPNSELTKIDTEIKGYFNDPALVTDGFKTYNILHETYALTRIVAFVLTGKINHFDIKQTHLNNFIKKGLASNKTERFQSVNDLEIHFNQLLDLINPK